MSCYYGMPGDYISSPYVTYPPSGSSEGSQGRTIYTPVASTSAIPYTPLPPSQISFDSVPSTSAALRPLSYSPTPPPPGTPAEHRNGSQEQVQTGERGKKDPRRRQKATLDEFHERFESSTASTTSASVDPVAAPSNPVPPLSTPIPNVTTVSFPIPIPIPDTLPRNPIFPIFPVTSQTPSLVPSAGEAIVRDILTVKEEALETTTFRKGDTDTNRAETSVKKESTRLGEDFGVIKEEEDTLSIREEIPQPAQQSQAHSELSPTRIDPQARSKSLEARMEVDDRSGKGGHVANRRGQEVGTAGGEVTNNLNEKEPPSSDLSELDEGAISDSASEDSGAESIAEVLAKRRARRRSSASTIMREKKRVKKGVVAPFDHLNELLEEEDIYTLWWADPSVSPLVKAFILEREKMFRKQRLFANRKTSLLFFIFVADIEADDLAEIATKQQAALRIATTADRDITDRSLRNYLGPFASYLVFCTIAKIPAFPITSAITTLFLYQYRVNWPELGRSNHPTALRSFARRTVHLFDEYPKEYEELDSWVNAEETMRELQKPIVSRQSVARTSQSISVPSFVRKTRTASRTDSPATQSKPSPATSTLPAPSIPPPPSIPLPPLNPCPPLNPPPRTASNPPPPPPSTLASSRPQSIKPHFEIVIPQRRDPQSLKRPSHSQMFIESSISFASPRIARVIDLRNVPVPGLGDRFKSLRAVKLSTAVAVVYSQGYEVVTTSNSTSASVRCQGPDPVEKGCTFRIHATLDSIEEEWSIRECVNEHNHEPSQELKDVEWRPPTMNIDLIEAMYQVDRRGQLDEPFRRIATTKQSTIDSSQGEERANKRNTTQSPALSARSLSGQPFLAQTPIPPPSSIESLRRAFSPSSLLEKGPLLSNASSSPAPFTDLAPTSESLTDSLPPQLPPDDLSLKKPEVSEASDSTPFLLDLSTPPAPQLISFLKSLDPSLTPLAPLLHASGYKTLDALVELSVIGVDVRKRMYREIVIRGGKVESGLFGLLERKLVEAANGDYEG
ncbi:hypothetical protein JCM5353_008850 [Sporobolomyces roseus]